MIWLVPKRLGVPMVVTLALKTSVTKKNTFMISVNRYLRNENIPIRVLAYDYQGDLIFLVTRWKDV